MQALGLLKEVDVAPEGQQTLLILPAPFLKQFSPQHGVVFDEISMDILKLTMVDPGEPTAAKVYKLVSSRGSSWVSLPRPWLSNIGARPGDVVALFATADPNTLLVMWRKGPRP